MRMKYFSKHFIFTVFSLFITSFPTLTKAQTNPQIPYFKSIEVSALNNAKQFAKIGDTILFDIHFREKIIIRSGEINFTVGQEKKVKTVSFNGNNQPGKHYRLQYVVSENDTGVIKISDATFTTSTGLKAIVKGPYVLAKTVQIGALFPEHKDSVLDNIKSYEYSLATAHQENRGYAARKSTYVNRYGETVTVGIKAGKISTDELKRRSQGYQHYLKRRQNTSIGLPNQRFESTPSKQMETLLRKRHYMKEKNSPLDS